VQSNANNVRQAQDIVRRPSTSTSIPSRTHGRRPGTGSKAFLRRLQADVDSRETRLQVVAVAMISLCPNDAQAPDA
jgi:hypothetical protein